MPEAFPGLIPEISTSERLRIPGPWRLWGKSQRSDPQKFCRQVQVVTGLPSPSWPQAGNVLQATESCVPGLDHIAPPVEVLSTNHALVWVEWWEVVTWARSHGITQYTLGGLLSRLGGVCLCFRSSSVFFSWATVSLWSYAHYKSRKRFSLGC